MRRLPLKTISQQYNVIIVIKREWWFGIEARMSQRSGTHVWYREAMFRQCKYIALQPEVHAAVYIAIIYPLVA
jgi:hypothetical protein